MTYVTFADFVLHMLRTEKHGMKWVQPGLQFSLGSDVLAQRMVGNERHASQRLFVSLQELAEKD